MYGSWKLQENGVGGAKEEVAFLNVHTTGKKRGGVVTHLVSSLKQHCLPMVHSNTAAPFFHTPKQSDDTLTVGLQFCCRTKQKKRKMTLKIRKYCEVTRGNHHFLGEGCLFYFARERYMSDDCTKKQRLGDVKRERKIWR